jgi:hypothetical protein
MLKKKATKKRKPGPVPGSKRTNRNERLADRLIDGTVAGLRAKAGSLELYEYLATLAGVQNVNDHAPDGAREENQPKKFK